MTGRGKAALLGAATIALGAGCGGGDGTLGDGFPRGSSQLFVIAADGRGIERLTGGDGQSNCPSWSPDGRRVALRRSAGGDEGAEILIVDPGDGDERSVGAGDVGVSCAAWSPDGRRVAFARSDVAYSGRISVADAGGGGEPDDLAHDSAPFGDEYRPSWSPDSRRIAYTAIRRGPCPRGAACPPRPPGGEPTPGDAEIATVDVASSRITTLTNRPDRAEGEPVWSPDDRFLAYGFREDGPGGAGWGIATMPAGGGREQVVLPGVRTMFAARAKWSADGRWVAAAGGHGGSVPVTVATPRGRPRIEIGDQTHSIAWSQSGATLAYALPDGIRVVRPGERPRAVRGLTRSDLTPRFLSWSPDGRAITFAGHSDLTVLDVGSGRRRSLYTPKEGETVGEVAWSPDGRRIAFIVSRASPPS